MPAQKTSGGGLGALLGMAGIGALAGVLVTVMVAPAIAVTGVTANSTIGIFESLPDYIELNQGAQQNQIVAINRLDEEVHIANVWYQNREEVPLEEMSPHLLSAAIAGEDRRFYEHGGVDLPSVMRAAVGEITGEDAGGASTLTMQTVRNILIQEIVNNPEYDVDKQSEEIAKVIVPTYDRKLREMKYAIGLEKRYSKDEILEGYLNIAGFGGNTYGVQAASEQYFSKDASELTVAEAASLLAIVQQPEARKLSDPENYERNQGRRDFIINMMFSEGFITAEERDEAIATPVDDDFVQYTTPQNGCFSAAIEFRWPCDYAVRSVPEIESLGATAQERRDNWRRGGYKLVLSIDPRLQGSATEQVRAYTPGDTRALDLGSAVSTVEVGTGRILIMAQNKTFNPTQEGGGRGATAVNYNSDLAHGGSVGFQPGSTWKPYVLLAFLDAGHGINETFNAGRLSIPMSSFYDSCIGGNYGGPNWTFRNDAGERGLYTVTRGTTGSVNSVFVQMATDVDQCRIKELAASIGVHRADGAADGSDLYTNPACSIGTCDNNVAPLTQAAAYAAIANQGVYCAPIIVDRVVGPRGEELEGQNANCQQSLVTPEVANTAATAMLGVANGTASSSNPRDGIPYIAKTGTTDNSQHTWMIGTTTEVSTAVWVGNAVGRVPLRSAYVNGRNAAVLRHSIFLPVATALNQYLPGKAFPEPDPQLVAGAPVYVPTGLIGQTPEYAKQQIELVQLSFRDAGEVDSDLPKGMIARVEPGEGARVSRGTEVRVYTSNGSATEVPDVSSGGLSFADARSQLEAAGFSNIAQRCQEHTDQPPSQIGTVIGQDPSAGTVTNKNQLIRLTVLENSCGGGGGWGGGGRE